MCKYIFSFLTLLLAFSFSMSAQERDPNVFYGRCFSSSGDTLYYRALFPKGYKQDGKHKYPLVLVLHSESDASFSRKIDNIRQLVSPVAQLFKRQEVHDSFPAIVLLPQCEKEDLWAEYTVSDSTNVIPFPDDPEQTYSGELAEKLVRYYLKHHAVDEDRVYAIGQGFAGGSGVLDLAARNPKMFAAVVSLGGALAQDRTKSLKKTPVRLYSSSAAVEVPLTLVNDTYIGLKMYGSMVAEPVMNYPNVSELDVVKNAVSTEDFLKWIFSKKK